MQSFEEQKYDSLMYALRIIINSSCECDHCREISQNLPTTSEIRKNMIENDDAESGQTFYSCNVTNEAETPHTPMLHRIKDAAIKYRHYFLVILLIFVLIIIFIILMKWQSNEYFNGEKRATPTPRAITKTTTADPDGIWNKLDM